MTSYVHELRDEILNRIRSHGSSLNVSEIVIEALCDHQGDRSAPPSLEEVKLILVAAFRAAHEFDRRFAVAEHAEISSEIP